ncbi:MAG: DUF4381 domain-containing protein [Pseudomonadota bacterium]
MNPESLPLRDIHLPTAISWWPLAPGWWLLAVVIVSLLGWAIWRYFRIDARRRRVAQQRLVGCHREWRQHQEGRRFVADVSLLLRRYAIAVDGRERVAGLAGNAWIAHLNSGQAGELFGGRLAGHLLTTPYRGDAEPMTEAEVLNLLSACRQWLASK